MQTFLPYEDFKESAQVLDDARLGKQRVEALSLLRGYWYNHPASIPWHGCGPALAWYGVEICLERRRRPAKSGKPFNENLLPFFLTYLREHDVDTSVAGWSSSIILPPWLGIPEYHRSHRCKLLSKKFEYYSKFGWDKEIPKVEWDRDPTSYTYWWPSKEVPHLCLKRTRTDGI